MDLIQEKLQNIFLLIFIIVGTYSCFMLQGLNEGKTFVTRDGQWEIWENGNVIEAVSLPISKGSMTIKGLWEELPDSLRESIQQTREHESKDTLR